MAPLLLAPPGAAVGHAADFRVVDNLTVPTGNAGIGTTAPARRLDVVGASGVGIGTAVAGDAFIISATGNIGIGTAAPLNNLDISGKVRVAESAYYGAEYDNGNSGAADTIDWGLGNKQKSTLTGNCTFTFIAPPGQCNIVLKLAQDATGSRTVTWPSSIKWPGGTAPTLTTSANGIDIISFYYDGTNYYGVATTNFQ